MLEYFNSGKEREEDDKERYRLEEKLRRVKLQFREGDIDPREYQQEMELTRSSLAKIHVPKDNKLLELGDHVEGLVAAWEHATKEERHDLLKMMLDGVYVDMTEATVVAVQPKPPFLPLFNLKEPVRSGEALLVAGGIDQSGTTSTRQAGRGFKRVEGHTCGVISLTDSSLIAFDLSLLA